MSGIHDPGKDRISDKTKSRAFQFWNDPNFEPKRTFRWNVEFDDLIKHFPSYYVISAARPSISFEAQEIQGQGHKKYYPKNPSVSPIEIVCIDDEYNTVTNWVYWYYKVCGIAFDATPDGESEFSIAPYTEELLKDKTRDITISMLTSEGTPTESWVLKNAWIAEFKSSPLNYTDSGLSTYTLKIQYDSFSYAINNNDKLDYNNKERWDNAQIKETGKDKSNDAVFEKYHGGTNSRIVKTSIPVQPTKGGTETPQPPPGVSPGRFYLPD